MNQQNIINEVLPLLIAICFLVLFPEKTILLLRWIRAILLDLLLIVLFIPMRLLALLVPDQPPKGPSSQAILLVHGYLNGPFVWLFLKWFLKKRHLGPIYTIRLGPPFASIERFSNTLSQKIEDIVLETHCSKLILIGHSMGGIVSLYCAKKTPYKHLLHIITLGSPLKGTHIAKLGLGQCAREMEVGSSLLEQIQGEATVPSLYHIATQTDPLVIPYRSAFLTSDTQRTYLFHDLGHIGLLFSPRCARIVCSWIEGGGGGALPQTPAKGRGPFANPSD